MSETEVVNWIVALPLLVMAGICLLWGADLTITEVMVDRPWWYLPLRSGSFHLGLFFIIIAIFLFGVLGVFLVADPDDAVPIWFAAPMALASVHCALAWRLLSFQDESRTSVDEERDES